MPVTVYNVDLLVNTNFEPMSGLPTEEGEAKNGVEG